MKYFFTLLLFALPLMGIGQNSLGNTFPGYVIKNDGTKVDGFIKRLSKMRSQNRVVFFTDADDKDTREVFKPEDLSAYRIAADVYESIPYGHLNKSKKHFLLRYKEGKISQYGFFREQETQGEEFVLSSNGNSEIVLDLDGEEIVVESIWVKDQKEVLALSSPKVVFKFKKIVSEYLSDYPALAKKVANKEKGYRIVNIERIIDEYNAHFDND